MILCCLYLPKFCVILFSWFKIVIKLGKSADLQPSSSAICSVMLCRCISLFLHQRMWKIGISEITPSFLSCQCSCSFLGCLFPIFPECVHIGEVMLASHQSYCCMTWYLRPLLT